jgi:hypothetical protein
MVGARKGLQVVSCSNIMLVVWNPWVLCENFSES